MSWEEIVLFIQYMILGAIQGFTEPIPISSSGHLVIVEHLFGVHFEGLSFETLLNFASLLAVLVIYRLDIMRLAEHFFKYIGTRSSDYKQDFMFVWYLVLATIPAAVIGLLLNDFISETLKGIQVIGVTLIVTGIALWLIRNLRGRKNDGALTVKDALIVGFAQAIALIPGISRSGATIVAAMGLGMKHDTALRFSFLLYIPISLGGMILEGADLVSDPNFSAMWLSYFIAFVVCFIASYYSLRWFMGIMQRGNLKWFSYYCLIAGACVLIFL